MPVALLQPDTVKKQASSRAALAYAHDEGAPLAAALAFALHAAWRGVWAPLQLILLVLAVRWALLALQGGLGALLWPLALIVRGSAGRSSSP